MKKINIIYTLSLVLILGSCSKNFLQRPPATSVPTSTAFNSASAFQSALNGLYANLRSPAIFGRDFPIIGDVQADNAYIEVENSGRYIPQWQYTVVVTDATASEIWSTCYNAILEANNIIDAPITGFSTTDQATITQIKGQAYGMRGVLYFKLINYFATPYTKDSSAQGVPIIIHFDPTLYPARNSVGEVYTQIVSDLKAGFASAPTYSNSITLSNYAIEGLLARTYLYMGDNTDAEAAASDVITNSGFSLVTAQNLPAFWANAAVQSDQTEVMFEVDCNVLENNLTGDLGGFYFMGYQDAYCSADLYNLYSPTDARRMVIDSGFTKSGAAAFVVEKFPNYPNADKDNLKVIRLAEVYLIAAEADVTSNPTAAQDFLNTLFANRDPSRPKINIGIVGTALLDTIVNERRKELAFEGDRFFDLNRLGWPVSRTNNNPGSIPAGTNNVNLSIPFGDYRRLAPIPQSETQVNPNIAPQQNPGY